MPKTLTEAEAIEALHRLAARWPQSIGLFSWSGTLCVVKNEPRRTDPKPTVIDRVYGIPNDGGDP